MYAFAYHTGKHFHDALVLWWARNVVADDPSPEYTCLDRLDGLGMGTNK